MSAPIRSEERAKDWRAASCSAEVFVEVFESLDYEQLAMIAAQAIHRMTDKLKSEKKSQNSVDSTAQPCKVFSQ